MSSSVQLSDLGLVNGQPTGPPPPTCPGSDRTSGFATAVGDAIAVVVGLTTLGGSDQTPYPPVAML